MRGAVDVVSMAQRTKTDTVTPPVHQTTPPEESRERTPGEPANDNDQVVFTSWDAALVPPNS